jgi:hypothetical protein
VNNLIFKSKSYRKGYGDALHWLRETLINKCKFTMLPNTKDVAILDIIDKKIEEVTS